MEQYIKRYALAKAAVEKQIAPVAELLAEAG